MFDNIGQKIKGMATAATVCGMILSCLGGLALMGEDMFIMGLLVAGVGSLVSWLGSLVLYGFGELIDNSSQIVHHLKQDKQKEIPAQSSPAQPVQQQSFRSPTTQQKPAEFGDWKCECGRVNRKYVSTCACGRNK